MDQPFERRAYRPDLREGGEGELQDKGREGIPSGSSGSWGEGERARGEEGGSRPSRERTTTYGPPMKGDLGPYSGNQKWRGENKCGLMIPHNIEGRKGKTQGEQL
jgi:hypothetical protein